MGALVIVAYDDYRDTAVEQEILKAVDADVVQLTDMATLHSHSAAKMADALMVTTQPVSAVLIKNMPRCRVISRTGTGTDAIDLAAATNRGIWVANVPDYAVDEVSTHTIALLLAHARQLPQLLDSTRDGGWDYSIVRPIARLSGQTLGLIGFGRIAQAVAAKARAFGLKILAHDRYIDPGVIEAMGARPVDFDTLLRTSDFVSLHTPLTDTTRNIIDGEALSHMKPTALLINTARGGLVDEDALLAAVRAKQIARAALDVLPVEPPTPNHPLLQEERIWVTPHSAWYSEESATDMRARAAEEVVRVLRGEPPRSRVNDLDGQSAR